MLEALMTLALKYSALRALARSCSARSAGDRGESERAGMPLAASARMARSSAERVGTVRCPNHPITASPIAIATTITQGIFAFISLASAAIIPHKQANPCSVLGLSDA